MRRLHAPTRLGVLLATSALADAHSGMMTTYQSQNAGDLYASELIGTGIYSAETEYDAMNAESTVQDNAERTWDDLGEVNDVVLSRDGEVKAVILGAGGFLGMGEHRIAVTMDELKILRPREGGDVRL
ncbi:PRC-barrel domain-containing protein [uncultured Roseobacter sp.]|uniref:PRC-barrel domain-containing protein n=1 Tax=uncultured Roseobacter sp. TaxID=114847 RepID=UPI0026138D30|nr:PRC-barrel domain-containing protein [uncultured Roseobacter sp.]